MSDDKKEELIISMVSDGFLFNAAAVPEIDLFCERLEKVLKVLKKNGVYATPTIGNFGEDSRFFDVNKRHVVESEPPNYLE